MESAALYEKVSKRRIKNIRKGFLIAPIAIGGGPQSLTSKIKERRRNLAIRPGNATLRGVRSKDN